MWSLIVKHKNQIVIQKDLTAEELSNVNGFGAQWILDAFQKYIGLDIGSYRLDEWDKFDKGFILYIRTEDLEKLRDNKLNTLGI
jgi:hypothetical protein